MRGQQEVYFSARLCIYIYIYIYVRIYQNLLRQETIIIKAYRSHNYREAIIIKNTEVNSLHFTVEGTK